MTYRSVLAVGLFAIGLQCLYLVFAWLAIAEGPEAVIRSPPYVLMSLPFVVVALLANFVGQVLKGHAERLERLERLLQERGERDSASLQRSAPEV
jgi:hypothetical protein